MDNFIFQKSWLDVILKHVNDEKVQNDIFRAIINYGIEGKKKYPAEATFLDQVFAQIDSAKEKRQKRVEAGRKGGFAGKGTSRNKGNKNAEKKNNSKTKANENENVNENVNDSLHSSLLHSSLIPHGYMSSSEYLENNKELGDEYE